MQDPTRVSRWPENEAEVLKRRAAPPDTSRCPNFASALLFVGIGVSCSPLLAYVPVWFFQGNGMVHRGRKCQPDAAHDVFPAGPNNRAGRLPAALHDAAAQLTGAAAGQLTAAIQSIHVHFPLSAWQAICAFLAASGAILAASATASFKLFVVIAAIGW